MIAGGMAETCESGEDRDNGSFHRLRRRARINIRCVRALTQARRRKRRNLTQPVVFPPAVRLGYCWFPASRSIAYGQRSAVAAGSASPQGPPPVVPAKLPESLDRRLGDCLR